MPVRIDQLPQQLGRGLAPVYLVAGDETLLVLETADAIRKKARTEGFAERVIFTVDRSFDWQQLGAAGESQSLFAQRRIIELRIPTGKPGRAGSQAIADYLEQASPDDLLLIICTRWDAASRKAKWCSAVDKAGVYVQIWPVRPQELPGWVAQRMRRKGLQPDQAAVMRLSEQVEGNLLAAAQEVHKLWLLKGQGPVTLQDVEQAVVDSARFDVFKLIECLLAGRLRSALRMAGGLQREGQPMQPVLGALTRELTILSQLHAAEASGASAAVFKRMNVWPSRQKPLKAAAERLTRRSMDQVMQLLARIDKQSKGRADGDCWQTLEQMICLICGKPVTGAA